MYCPICCLYKLNNLRIFLWVVIPARFIYFVPHRINMNIPIIHYHLHPHNRHSIQDDQLLQPLAHLAPIYLRIHVLRQRIAGKQDLTQLGQLGQPVDLVHVLDVVVADIEDLQFFHRLDIAQFLDEIVADPQLLQIVGQHFLEGAISNGRPQTTHRLSHDAVQRFDVVAGQRQYGQIRHAGQTDDFLNCIRG